jgi:uncharacterized membrane protein
MSRSKQAVLQNKIQKLVFLAILAAIIVVLQTFAGSIPVGPFTITLSLIPIMLGAILYGPCAGAFLGAVFGVVVCVAVVTGTDMGGNLMFQQLPVLTLFLCMLKSTVAGFVSGLICKALQKKNLYLGVALASVACPVMNTGILATGMLLFYGDLVTGWALANSYSNAFLYIIFGMVGVNFLVEMAINLVLIPACAGIIRALKAGGLIKLESSDL